MRFLDVVNVSNCLCVVFHSYVSPCVSFPSSTMVSLSNTIDTGHEDMIHDAAMDYYGTRMATASSDR